jgi:hypothetical protein
MRVMFKSGLAGFRRGLMGLALMAAAGAGPAFAQQQDPFGGQFGVQEIALPPAEALKNAEMFAAELSSIPPQRPGVVDTYILVASLWNDPVFEKEAKEAAAILGRHFDATDRTIILSAGQGPGAARAYPTADPNNLQAALAKLGKVADPNEDLVVVFITSHGAPNGTVALQEKGRLGGGWTPLQFRSAIAAAGIKRKVAIISACFSGNFILPMGDADTAVLTAAAADKTSFGCQPNRDWTYFGDALFNHALRSGAPLLESYDTALNLIDSWENKLIDDWDRLPASQKTKNNPRPEHSNPLSHVGDNMDQLIAKAEGSGVAVACAANLSFALDRAKTGRPLKGAADVSALTAAKSKAEAKAQELAKPRNRTAQDVARVIAAEAASVTSIYSTQADAVSGRAAKCATSFGAANAG